MRIEPIEPVPGGFPDPGAGADEAGAAGAAGAGVGAGVSGAGVGCGMCRGSDSIAASGPSHNGSGVGAGVGSWLPSATSGDGAADRAGSTALPPALPRRTSSARATTPGISRERAIRVEREGLEGEDGREDDRGTESRCGWVRAF